jgi:small subunit ribosomal protein S1
MVVLSKEKAAHKQNWDKIVKVFQEGGLVRGKVKASSRAASPSTSASKPSFPARRWTSSRRRTSTNTSATFTSSRSSRSTTSARTSCSPAAKSSKPSAPNSASSSSRPSRSATRSPARSRTSPTSAPSSISRHGRPAPHHRHVVGPHQPSFRTAPHRPVRRCRHPRRGQAKKSAFRSASSRCPRTHGKTSSANTPSASNVKGKVTKLLPYGAFVEIERGVEGLVHVSELSWVKRITRPSDVLEIGQEIEAVVLGISIEEQKISLGVRQLDANPWDEIELRYPVGATIKGPVRNLTAYGAFVELEEGIDGMIHVSDMSWTRKINHPSEVLKKRRRSGSHRARHRQGQPARLPRHQADRRRSMEPHRQPLQGRRPRQGHGRQDRLLRRLRQPRR